MRRKSSPGLHPAGEPDAAQRAVRPAALRFQAEEPALCTGPAALEVIHIFRDGGAVERCSGKILLPVTQKGGIARDAAALRRAGQILDVPHQIALFIAAGGDEAPHGFGGRINRTRHCSPARPADHP